MSNVDAAKRRRQEKLRASRGKQNLIMAAVALSAVLLAVGAYVLVNSDIWLLETISVSGNRRVKAERIKALSGLNAGTNILRISREEIEKKIETDPHIASAALSRDLPSRLAVTVVERRPFVGVKEGGKLFSLDKDGFVIEQVPDGTSFALPVMNEISIEKLSVGKRVKGRLIRDALRSLNSLDPDLLAKVVWVSVPTLDKLAFHTVDKVEIIFGDHKDAPKKNYMIKKILADSTGNIIHINVSSADTPPVVRKLK